MHQHAEPRRRSSIRSGAPLVLLGAVLLAGVLLAFATVRVEVTGSSMEPTLAEGDRLVVLRLPRWWPLAPGQLVALFDPRSHRRSLMVKRVYARLGTTVEVRGDNAAASTDSRSFGPVDRRVVVGRAVYRYAPAQRSGLLRGGGSGTRP